MIDTLTCTLCEGPLVLLGTLGRVTWSRCRNCGAQHSVEE